jgi:hypothetical protein
MRNVISFLIFSFFLSLGLPASADENDILPPHLPGIISLENLTFETINGLDVYFNSESDESVEAKNRFSIILPQIYSALDFDNISECRRTNLRIFFIRDETLNNREIMNFLRWDSWENRDIWGAYNKTTHRIDQEIFISLDASGDHVNFVAAHEFYHRFQDITCQNLKGPSVESDAVEFTRTFCEENNVCVAS